MAYIYKVEGMSCGGCSSSVEQAIQSAASNASVEVDLEGGLVKVDGVDDDGLIQQAIESAGFVYTGKDSSPLVGEVRRGIKIGSQFRSP
jgi:copper chaperone